MMDCFVASDMSLDSNQYKIYEHILAIFTEKVRNHLQSSYSTLSGFAPVILDQFNGALTEERAFFSWAVGDIHNMFHLPWEHLAFNGSIFLEGKSAAFERKEELIDGLLRIMSMDKAGAWVAARMVSFHEHELEWNNYKGWIDALLEETERG